MTKVKTRERLIKAALTLFQRHGYYGTGTQDVLELAKAPRGSLYHHFPGGKAELAEACVEVVVTEFIGHIRGLRLEGKSPVQVLEGVALGIAGWLEEKDWKEGMILPVLTHEFAGKDAKMHDVLKGTYETVLSELSQMFVVGGMDVDEAYCCAGRVIAYLEGAAGLARALKSKDPLTRDIDWNLLLPGA